MSAQEGKSAVVPLIEARGLTVGYGDLAAVRDLDLVVHPGEIVAVVGPNGAGKTTTLLALAGVLQPMSGEVRWKGDAAPASLSRRAQDGMAYVPESHSVFSGLSVLDNIRVAGVDPADVIGYFPELEPLLGRPAGLLSGGEQQMLTVGRAIARRPEALVIDELSMGLAPVIVTRLFEAVDRAVAEDGTAVLMVEQQARRALQHADRWYLLQQGGLTSNGTRTDGAEALAGYLTSAG